MSDQPTPALARQIGGKRVVVGRHYRSDWWHGTVGERRVLAWLSNPTFIRPPVQFHGMPHSLRSDPSGLVVALPPRFRPRTNRIPESEWVDIGLFILDMLERYLSSGALITRLDPRMFWQGSDRTWNIAIPPSWKPSSPVSQGIGSDPGASGDQEVMLIFARTVVSTCIGTSRFRSVRDAPHEVPIEWLNLVLRCLSIHARPDLASLRRLLEGLRSPASTLLFGAVTDRGKNPDRPVNEDSIGFVEGPVSRVVVADGLGGHEAGEVASASAVRVFLAQPIDRADLQHAVVHLFQIANKAVFDVLDGVVGGTTMTAAIVSEHYARFAHVGDSRAYHYGPRGFVQVTEDHTLLAAMVSAGLLDPASPEAGKQRNKLLRSLGSSAMLAEGYVNEGQGIDHRYGLYLEPGEGLLLLSDGAWDVVDHDSLAWLCRTHPEPQQLCSAIVASALANGGPDNVSAVALLRPA